jgi:hypothetical protein
MRPIRLLALVVALAAWLAGLGLVFGAAPRDAAAPWKPFAACSVPGADGKPVAVMLTPGPTPGTWALIVAGTSPWNLAPMGDPQPVPPVPPTPPEPTPPPVPPPPAPDTPAQAAKKLAVDAAMKLPDEGRAQDAQKLAAVYKAMADQIPHSIDSIDKLITANKYAREIALGPQRAAVWQPWVKELGLWLDAQRAAGSIKTVEDCKPVWAAIGEGLAAVKGHERR